MSLSTEPHLQPGQILRAIDQAAAAGHDWRSLADRHFPDLETLLRSAQQRWVTVLGGAVDNAIETGGDDLVEDIRRAYAAAVDRLPGLRRVLDQHASHDVLEPLIRREHTLLARAAGVSSAAEVIAGHARHLFVPQQRRGLFGWLRAA